MVRGKHRPFYAKNWLNFKHILLKLRETPQKILNVEMMTDKLSIRWKINIFVPTQAAVPTRSQQIFSAYFLPKKSWSNYTSSIEHYMLILTSNRDLVEGCVLNLILTSNLNFELVLYWLCWSEWKTLRQISKQILKKLNKEKYQLTI